MDLNCVFLNLSILMYMTLSYVLDLAGAAVNQQVKKECAAKPSMFTVFTVFPGPKKEIWFSRKTK